MSEKAAPRRPVERGREITRKDRGLRMACCARGSVEVLRGEPAGKAPTAAAAPNGTAHAASGRGPSGSPVGGADSMARSVAGGAAGGIAGSLPVDADPGAEGGSFGIDSEV